VEHVFAKKSNRCVVCGVLKGSTLAAEPCRGNPVDDDIVFLPPATTYDPEIGRCLDADPLEEVDPDNKPGDNFLCPVCACRPCLKDCRLGFSQEDLDGLTKKMEAKEHHA
jgi:hypothetical protein